MQICQFASIWPEVTENYGEISSDCDKSSLVVSLREPDGPSYLYLATAKWAKRLPSYRGATMRLVREPKLAATFSLQASLP
jgi:hypothetical protein